MPTWHHKNRTQFQYLLHKNLYFPIILVELMLFRSNNKQLIPSCFSLTITTKANLIKGQTWSIHQLTGLPQFITIQTRSLQLYTMNSSIIPLGMRSLMRTRQSTFISKIAEITERVMLLVLISNSNSILNWAQMIKVKACSIYHPQRILYLEQALKQL